jgi:hypothetical protein
MYKRVNFTVAATSTVIGQATKARVRVKDGQVQVRFTDRTSTINMPKDEMLIDLGVKGSGRRLSVPAMIAQFLPNTGTAVVLVPAKYGWMTVEKQGDAGGERSASISA